MNIIRNDRVSLEANVGAIENAVLASGDGEINKEVLLHHVEQLRATIDSVFGSWPEIDQDLVNHAEQPAIAELLPKI